MSGYVHPRFLCTDSFVLLIVDYWLRFIDVDVSCRCSVMYLWLFEYWSQRSKRIRKCPFGFDPIWLLGVNVLFRRIPICLFPRKRFIFLYLIYSNILCLHQIVIEHMSTPSLFFSIIGLCGLMNKAIVDISIRLDLTCFLEICIQFGSSKNRPIDLLKKTETRFATLNFCFSAIDFLSNYVSLWCESYL